MPLPNVILTVLDGQMGIALTSGKLLAIVGPSSSGAFDTPTPLSRPKDVVATFGYGPAVEFACYALERYSRQIVFVRSHATTAGTCGTLTLSMLTGTSVPTIHASPTPNDDRQVMIRFVAGGTIAAAGITYQISVDGGRNWSALLSLGTANSITIPNAGGVVIDLAAGTIIAGATIAFRTTAPAATSTDYGTALDALAASALGWEQCLFASPIDAAIAASVDAKFLAMAGRGKYRYWLGSFRMPNDDETEATYLTAFSTNAAAYATVWGAICAGAALISSSVPGMGYQYLRPTAMAVGPFQAAVEPHINIADINLGPLSGVMIRNDNGNVVAHDEAEGGGLDDARAITLRSWDGYPGVYVTRPRLFSVPGSDFDIIPKRRVMNQFCEVLRNYFIRRLNKPVMVGKNGRILKSEAEEIQRGAEAAARAVLGEMVSDLAVVVSLDDQILITKALTVDARLVPLAYPEGIDISVAFMNPAMSFLAAA